MFTIVLVMTRFLLFNCTSENTSNPNIIFAVDNRGSTSANMKHSLAKDFDYNIIKTSDLGKLKMLYINCNRKVFADSSKDLINIFLSDKELHAIFLKWTSTFNFKIENIRHSIANMLEIEEEYTFELLEEKKYTSENPLGIMINTAAEKGLNDRLIRFN